MIKNILIDLDGTLLPMNQEEFLDGYFKVIASKFKEFDLKLFMNALSMGINAMIGNDGLMTNEQRFWQVFFSYIKDENKIASSFVDLYENEFQTLIKFTQPTPKAKELIDIFKEKKLNIYCCTNPLFPSIATHSRIRWANLKPNDFNYITTYENSTYAKPNIKYYEEVLNKFNLNPEECIMIGNDVLEDLVVKKLNIKTFLLTDNLINSKNATIETDYQGNFDDLLEFSKNINK